MFELLLVLGIFLLSLFKFFKNHTTYWKDRDVVGPEPIPVFGNLFSVIGSVQRNPVLQLYEWTKQYGKVYGIQEGWRNTLVVSDVNMLQDVFLKKFQFFHGRKLYPLAPDNETADDVDLFHANGGRWKRLRSLSNPTFTNNNLKNAGLIHSTQVMIDYLKEKADSGKFFNIHTYFQELTLDVTSRIALGQKGSKQFNNPNFKKVIGVFKRAPTTVFHIIGYVLPFLGPTLRKIVFGLFDYGIIQNPFKELMDALNEAVKTRKEERSRRDVEELDEFGKQRKDFIDFFLEAESEGQLDNVCVDFKASGMKLIKKLSTTEIGSQCLLFLLAGFDTTANTLAFTIYSLAKYPEFQDRIRTEIDEVIGSDDVSYDHLGKLQLLDYAVKEALRLYPVASFANSRQCMETTIVGNMIIEKGTYIQADVFAVHRDECLWGEDADEYNPDRWEYERNHQAASLSFGIGPRMCVGMRLANMISKIALVNILTNFRIIPSPQIDEEMELVGGSALQPKAVIVRLEAI
ncbi:hypothetical protein QR680_003938 [Steinernema hermaphroditum]|uniref:Cytochrome P450 n=1 Tax=Steinernema hermaphroditum TaxID=289476 RepID=A0AA39LT77_9BILA|nr:hypothetical protein QR680_003938 [Steinernema hermaphroditum]